MHLTVLSMNIGYCLGLDRMDFLFVLALVMLGEISPVEMYPFCTLCCCFYAAVVLCLVFQSSKTSVATFLSWKNQIVK